MENHTGEADTEPELLQDGRTQRSLGHRSTPTLGHRKDAIYYVCATT